MTDKLKLSPTSLNLFLDCPRCFWLKINKKISRPSGPFPSLPGGVDYTLKAYFDKWRGQSDVPPILEGKIKGKVLADQNLMDLLRSSKFGFDFTPEVWFGGKLDDALMLDDGSIVPLDHKTHGFGAKEIHASIHNQMSSYTLMLRKNNIKTENLAYLVYYYFDHKTADLDNPLAFRIKTEEVVTQPDKIEKALDELVRIVAGPIPGADKDCDFCKYRENA